MTTSDWINDRPPHLGRALAWGALWFAWQIVRLPLLALLLALEPLVSLVLSVFGFLGIPVTIILKCSGDLPHFPFWGMMAFSIGSILVLMAYEALIGLLAW